MWLQVTSHEALPATADPVWGELGEELGWFWEQSAVVTTWEQEMGLPPPHELLLIF